MYNYIIHIIVLVECMLLEEVSCTKCLAKKKEKKKKEMVTALITLHEIQTHKRFKRMPFIRTKECHLLGQKNAIY